MENSKLKALAVCTTAIGDTLVCTPAMESLGRTFDLDVLVHQHRAPLLIQEPYIRKLFSYRNNPIQRFLLARSLKNISYDRMVLFHANKDFYSFLPRLDFKKAVNFMGWEDAELKLENMDLPELLHAVDKRLELAKWAGADGKPAQMKVTLTHHEIAEAEAWMEKHGLAKGRPRVALNPGAAYPFKRWPASEFGKAARRLIQRGASIVIVGSKVERELADTIEREAGQKFPRLINVSMRFLASALAATDLVITNDTGPLHLAQAVGVPVLALFGPTNPESFGPRGRYDITLKAPMPCEVCTTKRCEDPFCMDALNVDQVFSSAEKILDAAAEA